MKNLIIILIMALFFVSCKVAETSLGKGRFSQGKGFFILNIGQSKFDTITGIVTKIKSWKGKFYPSLFNVNTGMTSEEKDLKKKVHIGSIRYAKILSLNGQDSLEYRSFQGSVWQILRKDSSVQLLLHSYVKENGYVDYELNTSMDYTFDVLRLVKNDRKVDVPDFYLEKRALKKWISNRYFQGRDTGIPKSINSMLDLIVEKEAEM